MAVSTASGVLGDLDLTQNRRVIDMDTEIRILEPDLAPLFTFASSVSSRPARSSKVEWLEDELIPRITALTGTITNVATSVPVTANTGSYFRVNDVARIAETGENVLVTAVAASTLTVTRGYGTIAGTATTINGDLIRLGNAAQEGATLASMLITKQVAAYNYTQIFRNSAGFTNTTVASELYGESEPTWEMKKKLIEHKASIENQFFWGQRKQDTGVSPVRNVMGGVIDYISTNVQNIAGNLTEKNFETALRQGFRFGSDNKVFFCAPLLGSALSSFQQARLAPPSATVTLNGVSLQKWQSAQGQMVSLKVKRDWYDFQTVSTQGGAAGFLLDLDFIRYRPLRATKLLMNRQANDEDSTKHEYLTECSLQVIHERNHQYIKNATGY